MRCNRSKTSVLSCGAALDCRSSSNMSLVEVCPSQSAVVCSRTCASISRIAVIVIPGTCRAVILESVDSVEGVGDEGGGVGEDDDEVRESVGPGDNSEDEMSEGVRGDEGDDDSDGQAGEGGGIDISSSSASTRLKSSE